MKVEVNLTKPDKPEIKWYELEVGTVFYFNPDKCIVPAERINHYLVVQEQPVVGDYKEPTLVNLTTGRLWCPLEPSPSVTVVNATLRVEEVQSQ